MRRSFGSAGDADAFTADVRAYSPAGPRRGTVAVRAAGAISRGDDAVSRLFRAGGSGPLETGLPFGTDDLGLLRGFARDEAVGTRLALVNADVRWRLARVERGWGTTPIFVRWLHAAVFVDAGHAWSARFSSQDLKVSIGGELSVDAVVGYYLPVTVTIGTAWRRDGGTAGEDGAAVFLRFGRAF